MKRRKRDVITIYVPLGKVALFGPLEVDHPRASRRLCRHEGGAERSPRGGKARRRPEDGHPGVQIVLL